MPPLTTPHFGAKEPRIDSSGRTLRPLKLQSVTRPFGRALKPGQQQWFDLSTVAMWTDELKMDSNTKSRLIMPTLFGVFLLLVVVAVYALIM